jgi:formate dehydrogenase maturation protein FdhE
MYGDLITDISSVKRKLNEAVKDEICPMCGSPDIEASYGVFISRARYMQTMTCTVCSAQWKITYDNDLNVIDVNTGG